MDNQGYPDSRTTIFKTGPDRQDRNAQLVGSRRGAPGHRVITVMLFLASPTADGKRPRSARGALMATAWVGKGGSGNGEQERAIMTRIDVLQAACCCCCWPWAAGLETGGVSSHLRSDQITLASTLLLSSTADWPNVVD